MAPEKVIVTVQSSVGEEANLTVADAMRQILDFFELLAAAGGSQSEDIAWRLVSASTNSPLSVTAEAVSAKNGVVAEALARQEKSLVFDSFKDLSDRSIVPDWMDKSTRNNTKRIFQRNLNGIGKTSILLGDGYEPIHVIERSARTAISTIDRFEKNLADSVEDLSRIEYGSVEASILNASSFKGHPALKVREWLTQAEIHCVFSLELASRIGAEHVWAEAWTNSRVLLSGEIHYNRLGEIVHIRADGMESIDPVSLSFQDIADPNFTGGVDVVRYLDLLEEQEGA